MIDLYVIQPDDKEGIRINLSDTNMLMESLSDLCKLAQKASLPILKTEVIGYFESQDFLKSINVMYANGEYRNLKLQHDDIVFISDNIMYKCTEEDLEDRFGMTTDHRRIERD